MEPAVVIKSMMNVWYVTDLEFFGIKDSVTVKETK